MNFNNHLFNRTAVPLRIQAGNYIDLQENIEVFATGSSVTEFVVSSIPYKTPGNGTYSLDNTYVCVMANQYNSNSIARWALEDVASSESEISVSPNPASDFVEVYSGIEEETELEIYSLNGTLQYKANFTNNTRLNLGYLPTGVYIIKVYNQNVSKTESLIIE